MFPRLTEVAALNCALLNGWNSLLCKFYFNTAILQGHQTLEKESYQTEMNTSFIKRPQTAAGVHSSTPHLYIHDIESIT